jgi:hypothetical protein
MSPNDTPTPNDRDDRANVALVVVLVAATGDGVDCLAPVKEEEEEDCLRRCLSFMLNVRRLLHWPLTSSLFLLRSDFLLRSQNAATALSAFPLITSSPKQALHDSILFPLGFKYRDSKSNTQSARNRQGSRSHHGSVQSVCESPLPATTKIGGRTRMHELGCVIPQAAKMPFGFPLPVKEPYHTPALSVEDSRRVHYHPNHDNQPHFV